MSTTDSTRTRRPTDQHHPTFVGSLLASVVLFGLLLAAAYPVVVLGLAASTVVALATVVALRRGRSRRRGPIPVPTASAFGEE